jgi:NAD(P)H-flavin reductase
LESYAKDNQKFKLIPVMTQDTEWQGEKRQIDVQFIKDYFPNPEKNVYFITGAPQFAPTVFRSLIQAGATPKQLTMEIFTGY